MINQNRFERMRDELREIFNNDMSLHNRRRASKVIFERYGYKDYIWDNGRLMMLGPQYAIQLDNGQTVIEFRSE